MTARLMSLLIWAAVLASAVYWGLPWFTRATPVPAGAQVAQAAPPGGASLARLLGTPPPKLEAAAPPPIADSRFKLLGVVAARGGQGSGLALISVDGKPARTVGVGREIEPGLRLLGVSQRQAELGAARGVPGITLALPPPAEAQRGRPGEAGAAPGLALPPSLQRPPPGGAPGQMPMVVRPLPPADVQATEATDGAGRATR